MAEDRAAVQLRIPIDDLAVIDAAVEAAGEIDVALTRRQRRAIATARTAAVRGAVDAL